jgi:hypothetical protein
LSPYFHVRYKGGDSDQYTTPPHSEITFRNHFPQNFHGNSIEKIRAKIGSRTQQPILVRGEPLWPGGQSDGMRKKRNQKIPGSLPKPGQPFNKNKPVAAVGNFVSGDQSVERRPRIAIGFRPCLIPATNAQAYDRLLPD